MDFEKFVSWIEKFISWGVVSRDAVWILVKLPNYQNPSPSLFVHNVEE
jgi:hypothetical protein